MSKPGLDKKLFGFRSQSKARQEFIHGQWLIRNTQNVKARLIFQPLVFYVF